MAHKPTELRCPRCGGSRIWKNGHLKRRQLFKCQGCKSQFGGGQYPTGRQFSDEAIAEAVRQYYLGRTYRGAVKRVAPRHDVRDTALTPTTVMRWVRSLTNVALGQVGRISVATGRRWNVDLSTVAAIRVRCWQVIDEDSGYQLAVECQRESGGIAPAEMVKSALRGAKTPPQVLSIRALLPDDPYKDETCRLLRKTFPGLKIIQSRENPDHSPLLHSPDGEKYNQRAVADKLNRIKDPEAVGLYFRGWGVSYNFMESKLDGSPPPGPLVMANPPFFSWLDVIAISRRKCNSLNLMR